VMDAESGDDDKVGFTRDGNMQSYNATKVITQLHTLQQRLASVVITVMFTSDIKLILK